MNPGVAAVAPGWTATPLTPEGRRGAGPVVVLHITGQDLNRLSVLTFRNQPSADTPFVVVADTTATGGSDAWDSVQLAGVSGPQAPYMPRDPPDATTIDMVSSDSLEGTVHAPGSDFTDRDASYDTADYTPTPSPSPTTCPPTDKPTAMPTW